MHILATLLLAFYLPSAPVAPPLRALPQKEQAHPNGKWYLADTGHAVYCYGPVVLVKQPEGTLQRVATFCKGDQTMVPLRD
jgi:hypothetical protein